MPGSTDRCTPAPAPDVEDPAPPRAEVVPPPGVGRTALGVARIRAQESRRPDRLFDDPLAAAFLEAAPGALPAGEPGDDACGQLARWLGFFTALRTRFFDDYLASAVAAGARQVVLVAAGLDTRAYRLDWPCDVRLFELDSPQVLAFKQGVLDARAAVPRCARTALGTDLRTDWVPGLVDAGLDRGQPVAWLVEGLLVYLTPAEAALLLSRLTAASAPGSLLACELGPVPAGPGDPVRPRLAGYTELWKGGLGRDLEDRLDALGWTVAVHDRTAVAAAHGRTGPPSRGAGFVVATLRPGGPPRTGAIPADPATDSR